MTNETKRTMSQLNREIAIESTADIILSNIEILRLIFELLDFPNQLKFATVCAHLKPFYRRYISKLTFPKLTCVNCGNIGVKVLQRENLRLSLSELDYFLQIYGEDVNILKLEHFATFDTAMCPNLTAMTLSHMIVGTEDLESLSKNCPQLQSLEIYGCCNRNHGELRIGQDLRLEVLRKMTQLRVFSLKKSVEFPVKNNRLSQIMTHIQSQFHQLTSRLVSLAEDPALIEWMDGDQPHCRLEELHIYGPFQSIYVHWNLNTYLWMFPNLHTLSLIVTDSVNSDVLHTLAACCKNLQKLNFRHTQFEAIPCFSILSRLRELSFFCCKGLSYDNLREILSEMQLEKFSSTYTKYHGLFHYYFVSPTLKSINIDAFHSFEFRSS